VLKVNIALCSLPIKSALLRFLHGHLSMFAHAHALAMVEVLQHQELGVTGGAVRIINGGVKDYST
jgi:hypothetical protein